MKITGARLQKHLVCQWDKPFHNINQQKAITKKQWDKVYISSLYLNVRTFNCLVDAGIGRVSELLTLTDDELLSLKNFGKTSLQDIKTALATIR